MGIHINRKYEENWSENGYLGGFMKFKRFQQIHRYFTLRDKSVHPRQEGETFAWPVEPIAATVKQNCSTLWFPSSHLAIDEAMIPYCGRTKHKVKLPNKPIPEGYKVWALGDSGYIYDWLWHSRIDGPEEIFEKGMEVDRISSEGELTKILLAPTFALIIRLAQRLRRVHKSCIFCLFLDNLFLNVNVAQALLALRICCTGTTRKNAQGIPSWLITLKQHNSALVWNSALAEIVESTLCFLWQDNNAVLGITTAHPFRNDTVLRLRKRPSPTSTNARIVRPVFGDLPAKWLRIPRAIDDYNHYMNGVDRANQLRRNFTAHRPYERRTWRPLWYYILDVCITNSYLIWKRPIEENAKRGQRPFRKALAEALLCTLYPAMKSTRYKSMPLVNQEAKRHQWEAFSKRGYCVWCKEHRNKWESKRIRSPLAEIANGVAPAKRQRQSKTYGGCTDCTAYLCRKGVCFERFHRQ